MPAEIEEILSNAFPFSPKLLFINFLSLYSLFAFFTLSLILSSNSLKMVEFFRAEPVLSESLDFLVDKFGFNEECFKIVLVNVHV